MKFSEAVAEVDSAIMQACARFVTQVRPVLPLESLAVVLLDPERDTSRVVFSWGSPHQSGTPRGASVSASPQASVVAQPSLRLFLNGCQGPVGAVLIRSQIANGHALDVQELLQAPAGQLALVLENIQLQQRLERRQAETLAMERFAKIASSDATPRRIYRQFAGEIKRLMDYHRLCFHLADVEADLLTCVYRQGLGVRQRQPFESYRLSGNPCELAITEGQSYIIEDAPCFGTMMCAQVPGGQHLRSALVVPINFGGKVIGAIVPQNKRPNAYGPLEQRLLEQAARLLGPRIANTELYSRIDGISQDATQHGNRQTVGPLGRELSEDLAHALRSPLAAIKGYSSALLQTDITWPEELQREFLETIDRETDLLDQVVGKLLAPASDP